MGFFGTKDALAAVAKAKGKVSGGSLGGGLAGAATPVPPRAASGGLFGGVGQSTIDQIQASRRGQIPTDAGGFFSGQQNRSIRDSRTGSLPRFIESSPDFIRIFGSRKSRRGRR